MARNVRVSIGWWMRGGIVAAAGIALAGAPPPAVADGGPPLGAARTFAVLGGSSVSNTGLSAITGDVGVSPGTAINGFPPGTVTGGIHAGDAAATRAHSDAALAYAFLEGMWSSPANNLTSTDLGGLTLAPGVYKFNTSAQLTGALTLDAQGDSGALFVIQVGSTLTTSSGSSVTVINGGADYDESNVFWQVGSSATLGSGTAFTGNILAYSSITIVAGSSMTGNALALNGGVTMDSNTNTSPTIVGPAIPVPPGPILLTALLSGLPASPAADLRWTDATTDETEFNVYRRVGAGPDFVLVGSVASADKAGTGSVLTYRDLGLAPSTSYAYRVTAVDASDVESPPSNEALVDTSGVFPAVVSPLTLTAVLSGADGTPGSDLSWNDESVNETEFHVYRRDGAGPDFVQVGTVASADVLGTGGRVTYQDLLLDPSTTYTYRVTAFNAADGESAPSNEALVDTAAVVVPPARWLDVHLGRGHSFVRSRNRARGDSLVAKVSFSLIDVDSSVPVVLDDVDPRIGGVSVQVRAPGNLVLVTIAAGDPTWVVSYHGGVYRWRSRNGRHAPVTIVRINARKSELTLRSRGNDFGSDPVNAITVSLTYEGVTGSDTSMWNQPETNARGAGTVFKYPR